MLTDPDHLAAVETIRDHVHTLWGARPDTTIDDASLVDPEDPALTVTYAGGPVESPGTIDEAHWAQIYVRDYATMWPQVSVQPRTPTVLAVYPWPLDAPA